MSTINNNQDQNNSGSVILNLEKISKEYNNVLTQYNQARSNYINYLNIHLDLIPKKHKKNHQIKYFYPLGLCI